VDSITQIALGAAVGEAVLGRHVGRRAALWGGLCGLFPDLDLLVPLGDVVKRFTYHRGPSHSLFVLAVLTPFFVYMITKWHPDTVRHRIRWYALVYLAFATHVLLDCFTVYGTQIFWPLPTPPVMWSTIFIVDPAYSIPLFAGILAAMILTRRTRRGHLINTVGLILSTLYLGWSVGAKLYVDDVARQALAQQHIGYQRLLTVPTPFNTVLWRIVAVNDRGYYEGFYSLLDRSRAVHLQRFPSTPDLLRGLRNHWPVQRLQWFTRGFYAVERLQDSIVITDLRMGMEPSYVFRFSVGHIGNPHAAPASSSRVHSPPRLAQLFWVWQRIWSHVPAARSLA
jgi:inner membrane protein